MVNFNREHHNYSTTTYTIEFSLRQMNNLGEALARTSTSIVVSAISAAYWYRPVPNTGDCGSEPCRGGFTSRINVSEVSREK